MIVRKGGALADMRDSFRYRNGPKGVMSEFEIVLDLDVTCCHIIQLDKGDTSLLQAMSLSWS